MEDIVSKSSSKRLKIQWFNDAIDFCDSIDFYGEEIDTSDLEEVIAAIFHYYQLKDAKEKRATYGLPRKNSR